MTDSTPERKTLNGIPPCARCILATTGECNV
jgi:hypothetical protein